MHELPVIGQILKIVLDHAMQNSVSKIMAIDLEISQISDMEEEWMQRYFDSMSEGTVAQGAKLRVERRPLQFRCAGCSKSFEVDIKSLEKAQCPFCGSLDGRRVPGGEYFIKSMEAI
jgi:hydrogenase nickel incorporation protein HypA/HybF